MKKTVWILNHYAGETFFDNGGRHYWFAKYLKRAGYDPVIFCSNAQHNSEESFFFPMCSLWEERKQETLDVPYVFVKSRAYKGNGKDRILNMADFYANVQKSAKEYACENGKPDIIIASSVHPLTLIAGEKLAKKFGVPCICEVRDLWPESIVAYSEKFTKKNLIIKFLYYAEKKIYIKADAIIFTMEGAYEYIEDKGWCDSIPQSKVFIINNGVDLEAFNDNAKKYQIEDKDISDDETFKIVYAGSIRKANDIESLIRTARKIQDGNIKFLIWGEGDQLPVLQRFIREEKINNVIFKGIVSKEYVPYIISNADINYLDTSDTALLKYGFSGNKLFEYFAAKKPILMMYGAQYNPAENFGCCYINNNENDISAMIRKLSKSDDKQYSLMCKNCEKAAKHYDFKYLTEALINVIENEC